MNWKEPKGHRAKMRLTFETMKMFFSVPGDISYVESDPDRGIVTIHFMGETPVPEGGTSTDISLNNEEIIANIKEFLGHLETTKPVI